nr:trypsin inhibitor [Fagopyrum tataricum]
MKVSIERKLFAISCILLIGLIFVVEPLAAANDCGPGKSSWPELVGVKGSKASTIIKKENKFVTTVEICPPSTCVTKDRRCDRVRLFLDKLNGVVTKTPVRG